MLVKMLIYLSPSPHPESENEVAESDHGLKDAGDQHPYFPDENEDLPSLENDIDSPRQNSFILFSVTTGLPASSITKIKYPEKEISVSGNMCYKNITMSMKALKVSENDPISEISKVSMQIETSDDQEFNPLEASLSFLCSNSGSPSNQPFI